MTDLFKLILGILASRFKARATLEAENLRSPWQDAYVERLIGSIRRECLDHMIVFGEAPLRRILSGYAAYYNASRTHRSLNKDAPLHRAIERLGAVVSRPVLGGLHHQYGRI